MSYVKKIKLTFALGAFLTIYILSGVNPISADEEIWISADNCLEEITLKEAGFLHGVENGETFDDSLIAKLKPLHWRIAKFYTLERALPFNPRITYETSFIYAWNHGGPPNARPWEDWEGYEQFILNVMLSIAYYYPEANIEYYDVWNEPDLGYFWSGNYEQLLELFARTYNVVKTFDPGAKVVGPSIAWFRPSNPGVANIVGFLEDLDSLYDVRLDAVSWHENNSIFDTGVGPDRIPGTADQIRSMLMEAFGPDYQPELHINEYAGAREHLSPGLNIGYLYYLSEAEIDASMRACWNVYSGDEPPYDYWCDCWAGFDGMFMRDGFIPQPTFWIYKAYADMKGSMRLRTYGTDENTVALASREDINQEIKLLVGSYYQTNQTALTIHVDDYPYSHNHVNVVIERIPHYPEFFENTPKAIPLPDGPVDQMTLRLAVVDHEFDIVILANVNDGYTIHISEDQTSGIENEMTDLSLSSYNSPNPFNSITTISFFLQVDSDVKIDIYNLMGQRIQTIADERYKAGEQSISWDASGMSSGIYFYKLTTGDKVHTKRMTLLK
ncbi:MAG: T9SS type A sorting domain-containing protein [candidate division Zixibacteria bacterium]|nr:T9SS type A sorting domain-containing protein [candidate division Zixibacteria bacterium]